jgi:hypothetical protein
MKKICLLLWAVVVTIAPAEGQDNRFITEKDLLKFTWIADSQISPDGSAVALVRITVNEKDNKYESALFAVPSTGSQIYMLSMVTLHIPKDGRWFSGSQSPRRRPGNR